MKQLRYDDGTKKSLDGLQGFSLFFEETGCKIVLDWGNCRETLATYKNTKKAKSEFERFRESYNQKQIIEAPRAERFL